MDRPEQEQRAPAQPHVPIRRRGREPPKPPKALGGAGVGSGGHEAGGWQLHHSSSGLPFYFNCATGESVWARPSLANPRGTSIDDDGDGANPSNVQTRISNRSSSSSSGSSSGGSESSSSGSSGGRSSSPGTSFASSSSTGERKRSDGRGTLTSNSSETLTTSSASYASSDSFSRSNDDDRSLSISSHSSDTLSSSGQSWTESMETRFRQMITSEQGRKLLADEVEALTARQVRRAHQESTRETQRRDTKTKRRRARVPSYTQRELYLGDGQDVEMALLGSRIMDSDRDSSSSSSSSSSDSGSTGSSFSLYLSSGSDGGSDLSLLTSDVVLERLEKVEKVFVLARGSALSFFHACYGFARQAYVVVRAAVLRGATRARWRFFPGRLRSRSSSSFSPTAF